MAEFARRFPDIASWDVVDLGGRPQFWAESGLRPQSVICVNLELMHTELAWIHCMQGDACDVAGDLSADLVVSNSLIEHVGGHARRELLARTVMDIAPRHWIQTPYRYFPVEPHWMFPGMQFLPLAVREKVARRHWTQGTHYSTDYARRAVAWTELLSVTELRRLFPDSEIWHERVAGLTKSLVAVHA